MTTFARVTRCKRCKTAFHDLNGRCPDCNLRTRKGRRAFIKRVFWIVLSIAVAIVFLYLLIQKGLEPDLNFTPEAGPSY